MKTLPILLISGSIIAIAGFIIWETEQKKKNTSLPPVSTLPQGWHAPMELPANYVPPAFDPATLLPDFMQQFGMGWQIVPPFNGSQRVINTPVSVEGKAAVNSPLS